MAEIIFDRVIWDAALELITVFGREAATIAGDRSDRHVERGDFEGSALWQDVMTTILCLLAEKPEAGEAVQ